MESHPTAQTTCGSSRSGNGSTRPSRSSSISSKTEVDRGAHQCRDPIPAVELVVVEGVEKPGVFLELGVPKTGPGTERSPRLNLSLAGDGRSQATHHLMLLATSPDLLPENWSSYYESPMAQDGQKEDSLWANDTHRSRSCASCARRRQS